MPLKRDQAATFQTSKSGEAPSSKPVSPLRSFASSRFSFSSVAWLVFLLCAFALRVWGIRWGLPYLNHPDEPNIVDHSAYMARTAILNPHFFSYPSLYFYLQALVIKAQYFYGSHRGQYTSWADLPGQNASGVIYDYTSAPGLYLWGRTFTACLGVAAVVLTYRAGRAFWGQRAGLGAAILLAFAALHIDYSHFITVDVPTSVAAAATLWAVALLLKHGGWRYTLISGFMLGLTAGSKYNAVVVGLALPLALVFHYFWPLAPKQSTSEPRASWFVRLRWVLLMTGVAGIIAALVLLVTTPYIILTPAEWSQSLRDQAAGYRPDTTPAHLTTFFGRYLEEVWYRDPGLCLLALGGTICALSRRGARQVAFVVVLPVLAYVLLMSGFTLFFLRNMMAIYPSLAVLGGYFSATIWEFGANLAKRYWPTPNNGWPLLKRGWVSTAFTIVLTLLVSEQSVAAAVHTDLTHSHTDSRVLLASWVHQQQSQGARFAIKTSPRQWSADVLTDNTLGLADRSPAWLQAHGFAYVVLNDDLAKRESTLPYLKVLSNLPEVYHLGGYSEGGTGPTLHVLATGGSWATLKMQHQEGARFGDLLACDGYDLAPLARIDQRFDFAPDAGQVRDERKYTPPPGTPFQAGGLVGLQLYCRTFKSDSAPWQVFVHLLDAKGATVGQVDTVPLGVNGPQPTSSWYQGGGLIGTYPFALPATLPKGSYKVEVGFYRLDQPARLPVTVPGGTTTTTQSTSWILATPVIVK